MRHSLGFGFKRSHAQQAILSLVKFKQNYLLRSNKAFSIPYLFWSNGAMRKNLEKFFFQMRITFKHFLMIQSRLIGFIALIILFFPQEISKRAWAKILSSRKISLRGLTLCKAVNKINNPHIQKVPPIQVYQNPIQLRQ